MKTTGIVRRIDQLGRVVLPIELRKTLDISENDPMEIFVEQDSIVLKKYGPMSCIFCGERQDVITFKGKYVCSKCLKKLKFPTGEWGGITDE